MDRKLKAMRAFLYVINVIWSAFLIWESYQQTANLLTALLTVIILLGSMVLNDMIK